ncbi:unnamed protein product [Cuscuta campestris]|uniref:Uncharacterized protein n=1 Tax=Cuscuta campestris TaxID=132261 RepID=A0A484MBQ7_9ASTE|nr:unnamed protein product [Cuscuta campestris]
MVVTFLYEAMMMEREGLGSPGFQDPARKPTDLAPIHLPRTKLSRGDGGNGRAFRRRGPSRRNCTVNGLFEDIVLPERIMSAEKERERSGEGPTRKRLRFDENDAEHEVLYLSSGFTGVLMEE